MPALSKFLVLLALFLSASYSNAFVSLSLVAGNQVRVNHLTRLQQPMSNPTNEPSREPIREPTKRLGQDALLPVNLSSKSGLCHDKNSERVMFSNQGQDNEIQSDSTDSSNTQPSNWQGPKQRSLVISTRVPFTTSSSNLSSGLVYCWVHSHTGFESVSSSKKVSFSVFALLSREPVTSSKNVSCSVFTLLACVPATSSRKVSCSIFTLLVREPVTFMTRVSCNTFASLVCAPVTSSNQVNQEKVFCHVQVGCASVLNNNAISFNDKSSSMFKLVVASVTNEFSKGPTKDSPAKQLPVLNDDLAIALSLQLHAPMIRASIWQLNVVLIFERSIKMQPIFQLIDVFVLNKNDSCSLMAAHANFMRQLIDASKRGVLHAQLSIDDAVHSFSVSEGAQDVIPATIRKESFKVINGSNTKGARAKIQTYCCVKIASLKLQRKKSLPVYC